MTDWWWGPAGGGNGPERVRATWDPVRWLIDGNNLMGSRPDGWWRDRPRARRSLVDELAAFAAGLGPGELAVVFDGRPEPGEEGHAADLGVTVSFAGGGPDAADGVIAATVAGLADPAACTVVTSDLALAARVRAAGGTVMPVRSFRRRLGSAGGP